jgi:hypothetical protein
MGIFKVFEGAVAFLRVPKSTGFRHTDGVRLICNQGDEHE